MSYDIYDLETANLIESFDTEAQALAVVRQAIEEFGLEAVEAWSLGRSDYVGTALQGEALVRRALGSSTHASIRVRPADQAHSTIKGTG